MKRYILYAIGEILLVVVGILIALQINNWNEERKQRKDERAALADLKAEFENNRAIFLKHLTAKKGHEQNWDYFLNQLKQKKSPFKNGELFRPRVGSTTLNLTFGSLNTILSTGKIDRIRNDSLKLLLTSWNDILDEYTEDEKVHWDFNRNIFQAYETGIRPYPWLGGMSKGNEHQFIFHDKEERRKSWEKILKDVKYQNLMILQHNYLVENLQEGAVLQERFDRIIELLNLELDHH